MFNLFNKPNKELSDEQLFLGTINGREDLFKELYNRYNKRILYYFYRMLCNDETLAQDCTQELFYKILNKQSSFDPKRKFSTWLFSIAHNMCKNEYRSREVRKIVINSDKLDHYCDTDNNNHEGNYQEIKRIYTELNKLDETHRTAFLLKYREGLDLKEISEVLELPVGTIKSRLFYTRKKISLAIEQSYNQ